MKNIIILVILFFTTALISSSSETMAAKQTKNKKSKLIRTTKAPQKTRSSYIGRSSEGDEKELNQALEFGKKGKYQEAATMLFQISLSPKYLEKRMKIRYLLGLMLYQMKLYQMSAFQFVSVIRQGNNKYITQALEKLSLAANELGDDALLNYAISRAKTETFPAAHRDMLFFRIGEYQQRNNQYLESVRSFNYVPNDSPLYEKAMYMKGLSYAQANEVDKSIETFDALIDYKRESAINDTTRVAAQIGRARALYQKKSWDDAIAAYRDVPRDTELWHESLFESSWAMLRAGRFRSAISNFQSLHSPYYEESYLPESLLLRSIVYLYICQYDEMEKVLNLYNKIYRPVYKSMTAYLKRVNNPTQYFNDMIVAMLESEKNGFDPSKARFSLPYLVIRKISKEGDFQRTFRYIKKLLAERKIAYSMSKSWTSSAIGKFTLTTLNRRIQKARAKGGRQVRAHMINIRTALIDLFEQEGFIRYEMLNGKKEHLKKRVAGKELPKASVDENNTRDYYVQNGFEYWPFAGEYWLDELGNYHYLGMQSCE